MSREHHIRNASVEKSLREKHDFQEGILREYGQYQQSLLDEILQKPAMASEQEDTLFRGRTYMTTVTIREDAVSFAMRNNHSDLNGQYTSNSTLTLPTKEDITINNISISLQRDEDPCVVGKIRPVNALKRAVNESRIIRYQEIGHADEDILILTEGGVKKIEETTQLERDIILDRLMSLSEKLSETNPKHTLSTYLRKIIRDIEGDEKRAYIWDDLETGKTKQLLILTESVHDLCSKRLYGNRYRLGSIITDEDPSLAKKLSVFGFASIWEQYHASVDGIAVIDKKNFYVDFQMPSYFLEHLFNVDESNPMGLHFSANTRVEKGIPFPDHGKYLHWAHEWDIKREDLPAPRYIKWKEEDFIVSPDTGTIFVDVEVMRNPSDYILQVPHGAETLRFQPLFTMRAIQEDIQGNQSEIFIWRANPRPEIEGITYPQIVVVQRGTNPPTLHLFGTYIENG